MMAKYFVDGFDLRVKPDTLSLFLAEGDAEVGLLEAALELRRADPELATILCFKGVQKLTPTLAKLIDPKVLAQIVAFGVLVDSEDNPGGRIESIIACAKAFGFPRVAEDLVKSGRHVHEGKRFAASLSPELGKAGRIETLVIKEKGGDATMRCVAEALPCVAAANGGRTVNEKAQVQMYISAAMNNSMAGIGRAFRSKLFDITSDAYASHLSMVDFVLSGK